MASPLITKLLALDRAKVYLYNICELLGNRQNKVSTACPSRLTMKKPDPTNFDGFVKSPKNADMSLRAKRGNLITP